jgi:hypothetical protein
MNLCASEEVCQPEVRFATFTQASDGILPPDVQRCHPDRLGCGRLLAETPLRSTLQPGSITLRASLGFDEDNIQDAPSRSCSCSTGPDIPPGTLCPSAIDTRASFLDIFQSSEVLVYDLVLFHLYGRLTETRMLAPNNTDNEVDYPSSETRQASSTEHFSSCYTSEPSLDSPFSKVMRDDSRHSYAPSNIFASSLLLGQGSLYSIY